MLRRLGLDGKVAQRWDRDRVVPPTCTVAPKRKQNYGKSSPVWWEGDGIRKMVQSSYLVKNG